MWLCWRITFMIDTTFLFGLNLNSITEENIFIWWGKGGRSFEMHNRRIILCTVLAYVVISYVVSTMLLLSVCLRVVLDIFLLQLKFFLLLGWSIFEGGKCVAFWDNCKPCNRWNYWKRVRTEEDHVLYKRIVELRQFLDVVLVSTWVMDCFHQGL